MKERPGFPALEDSANLPVPGVLAADIDSRLPIRSPFGPSRSLPSGSIVEDLQAALAQFAEIAADLKK